MKKLMKMCLVAAMSVAVCGSADAVLADFEGFNIRNTGGTITAPWDSGLGITENAAGNGFDAKTPLGGQKVGYGTNAFDGKRINQLSTVNFDKVKGGPNVPYLNLWVTDGTNYAIISSENDYRGTNFSTRQEWKIFETNVGAGQMDWLFDSGVGTRSGQYLLRDTGSGAANVTLSDFSDSITFMDPGVYNSPIGTGAPRGGYGFNIIYGDTASNFVGGYEIENLTVNFIGEATYEAGNAVPEPATFALSGLALMGLMGATKRR